MHLSGDTEYTVMKNDKLKKCNACGNDISRHAPLCRHCGHPQGRPLAIWILGFFLLALVAFYLAVTLYCLCNVDRLRVFGPNEAPGIERRETGIFRE